MANAALTDNAIPQTLDQRFLKNIDANDAAMAALLGTGAAAQQVQGAGAQGSSTTVNPLVIGGINGSGFNQLFSTANAFNDAASNVAGGFPTFPFRYNAATGWDKERGNIEVTALASSARVAGINSADMTLYNGRGITVVIDLTAFVTAASLTVTIQGKDPLSGKYYTLLVSTVIASVITTVMQVGPGLTASANLIANALVPRTYRISVAQGNGNSTTYSVGVMESV